MERHVLVIGAGQAGLAAGYHLRAAGVPFQIVDSHRRVGDNWRTRYDSLTLFTPRQFSALPGLELAGNRELYATRDEFADYLESYAARLRLPVTLGRQVTRLSKTDGESFEAQLDDGRIIVASEVIVATGAFQRAVVPELTHRFGDGVLQLTTETYRNPNQLPDGPVLVVGDGASGRDIAAEVRPFQPVLLAAGRSRKLFPERVLGKSIWWWLNLLGVLSAPPESRIGSKLKRSDAFPDRDRSTESLASRGIRILPRLTEASGRVAQFADATSADIRTVIWAVGYQDDTSWLDIAEAKGPDGAFLHEAGISPVKGIYFVGRPWQRNRASALIMGAGSDAELIVQRLLSDRE
ncbi:putative flavoprotein involved in K+ transport [Rhizobium rosettiformans]|uniref:Potassium transporter n=2 Tax=Rhizobium rosettiformans TaxID=1368430 RepID=A0A4S8PNG9_9HYPH|nr:NAD(P)-binding domain-containing protein [Rhizobium rosettiformans]MBB5278274.1 putative flavoprotein involved in K+ transport [Rhizobium rosettiformans]THV32400.1 potassium transporter [Rhizobium rosettiformans W3]